jgi:hypothetical protein
MKNLVGAVVGITLGLAAFAGAAQTWAPVAGGTTNASAVGAGSGNTLYAGFNNNKGVYRSTDNGVNWIASNSGLLDGVGGAIPPAALFRTSTGRILRGGANASWNNAVGSPVFYSDNSGGSWVQATYPFLTPGNNPGGVSVSDFEEVGGAVFFSDTLSYGVWKSTDNGLTWNRSDTGLPTAPFVGYKFIRALAKSGSVLLAIDPVWGVYRSTDGGVSWQASRSGIVALFDPTLGDNYPGTDIHSTPDGTVYACVSYRGLPKTG